MKHNVHRFMFQGTGSNVGKSILTAALCRVLKQDGLNVAPFKAQNMSNNSFVTKGGKEISRAQAVQAQACGIDADERFSPIILKPNSEMGSQVILKGQSLGHMTIKEYREFKEEGFKHIQDCYASLSEEYDAIILEGAGSPAEINLKADDIVNMKMALYAEAPVALIGNIHLGGVYASFLGTMQILDPIERELVCGYIVNRFRGDASLLEPAHVYMFEETNKKVLGVVPEVLDFKVPEEDSVNFEMEVVADQSTQGLIDIAVIALPHVSNFTDFDALAQEKDVNLRKINGVDELGSPDLIILPGSKNTLADLLSLKKSGLYDAIQKYAEQDDAFIIGLCGGFQMLGQHIDDKGGIESAHSRVSGLQFLDMATHYQSDKILKQSRSKHSDTGLEVFGYEVHHGISHHNDLVEMFETKGLGYRHPSKMIWGTYLHGLFDADPFRHWFIDQCRIKKGLAERPFQSSSYQIETSLNRLADVFRENMNMSEIYRIMNLG